MRFLFVDRILQLVPGESVKGIKHVTRDDPWIYRNDDGQFCFAPSLIGESLGQLAAWNVMVSNNFSHRPVAGVVSSACLHRPVLIGETIILESWIDCLDERAVQYHSVARVGENTVFTVDGALGPLLPMANFISDEEIRQQFAEINRPGEWSDISTTFDQQEIILPSQFAAFHVPMLFDRVLQSEPGLSLVAEKRITRSAPYFPDHFPYNPVLPMTVLLECKLHLAREFLRRAAWPVSYEICELRKIKMNEFVHPGDVLCCYVTVLNQDERELVLRYRSEVDGKRVCVVDVILKAKG